MITYLEKTKNPEHKLNVSNKTCINNTSIKPNIVETLNTTNNNPLIGKTTSTFDRFSTINNNENITNKNFENFKNLNSHQLSIIISKFTQLSIAECINNKLLSFLDVLPKECIQYILCFLSAKDITTCACTSKKFNYFASSNYIWRKKCIEDFSFFLKHSGIRDLVFFSSYAYEIDDNFSKSHQHGKVDPYYYYDPKDRKKMSLINSYDYLTSSSYSSINNIVFDKNINKKKKEKMKSVTSYSLWQSIRSLKQLYIRILYPYSKYIGLWHADYPFHSGALISIELVTNIRIKNHTFIKAWFLNAKNKSFGTTFFSMDQLYTVDALDYVIEKVPFFEISIKPSEDLMNDDDDDQITNEEVNIKNSEEEFKKNRNKLEENIIKYISGQKFNINLIKSKLMNHPSNHQKFKDDNIYNKKTININNNKTIFNANISEENPTSLLLNESTSSTTSTSTKSQSVLKEINQNNKKTSQNNTIRPNINIKLSDNLNNNSDNNIISNNNNDNNNNSSNNIKKIDTNDNNNNINNNINDKNKSKNKNNVNDTNLNENKNSLEKNKTKDKLLNECSVCPSPIPIPNSKKLSQFDIENNSQKKHNTPMKKEDLRILFTESYIPKTTSNQHGYYNRYSYYNRSYSRLFSNNNIYNTLGVKSYYTKHNYFNSESMTSYYNSNNVEKEKTNKSLIHNNNNNNYKEDTSYNNVNNNENDNDKNIKSKNVNEDNTFKNENNSVISFPSLNTSISFMNDNNTSTLSTEIKTTISRNNSIINNNLKLNLNNNSINNNSNSNNSIKNNSIKNNLINNNSTNSNSTNSNSTNDNLNTNLSNTNLNTNLKFNLNNNNNNKNYLNKSSSNINSSLSSSIALQNNLEDKNITNKSSNIEIFITNDKNDTIESIDLYHDLINKSNITIFNNYNPILCIKKEKVPFTINISYTSCSHPVKLTLSPSSDIAFLNEIPNEHTGLWTSKKSFHVLQPSLITVIQNLEMDENENFEKLKNNTNKYHVFNLRCHKGCHLNKVRSLSIVEDKKFYENFLFNTSYSKINLLLSSHNVKESKSISLSNVKSDVDLTYSSTLSNSYPLTHNRSSFSILTSALTSFHSSSFLTSSTLVTDFNSSSVPFLDGIWIGTFAHHGLEFIYLKTYNNKKRISDSSEQDSLITLQNEELPIMINTEGYSDSEENERDGEDEEDENEDDNYNNFNRSFDENQNSDVQNENENENEIRFNELSSIHKSHKKVVAYKITGDVNIPKGEITWTADLSHTISSEMTTLEGRIYDISQSNEFLNSKIYKAEGVVAQIGYREIKKQPGKLIIISKNEIAILWEQMYRISRFKRYF